LGPPIPSERSEQRFGRRATDRLVRSPGREADETGSEGARLVALEMLDAGHDPEQVAGYLRDTFKLGPEEAAAAATLKHQGE
jgi:hypothetical protein